MEYRNRHQYYSDLGARGRENDGSVLRLALLLGAIVLGVSVLVAPFLQNQAARYAGYGVAGIDRLVTGSVQKTERYTVRRSVLWAEPRTVCQSPDSSICGQN